MNQIENRVEGIIEPDLFDWDTDTDDLFEYDFENLLEDNLEEFIFYTNETQIENRVEGIIEPNLFVWDTNETQIEAYCAEGNIICADEMSLISAD